MVWQEENPEQFREPECCKLVDIGVAALDEKKTHEIWYAPAIRNNA